MREEELFLNSLKIKIMIKIVLIIIKAFEKCGINIYINRYIIKNPGRAL